MTTRDIFFMLIKIVLRRQELIGCLNKFLNGYNFQIFYLVHIIA